MIRYYPLPTASLQQGAIGASGNASGTTGLSAAVTAHSSASSAGGLWLPPEVIAALLVAAGSLILVLSTTVARPRQAQPMQLLAAELAGRSRDLPYRYEGVALLLRRAYDRLRTSLGCSFCTPRELAGHVTALNVFADVYEAVVYGGIPLGREAVMRAIRAADSAVGGVRGGSKECCCSSCSSPTRGRRARGR